MEAYNITDCSACICLLVLLIISLFMYFYGNLINNFDEIKKELNNCEIELLKCKHNMIM